MLQFIFFPDQPEEIVSWGEMLGLHVCKSIANPVTNSKFATICHICTRANS